MRAGRASRRRRRRPATDAGRAGRPTPSPTTARGRSGRSAGAACAGSTCSPATFSRSRADGRSSDATSATSPPPCGRGAAGGAVIGVERGFALEERGRDARRARRALERPERADERGRLRSRTGASTAARWPTTSSRAPARSTGSTPTARSHVVLEGVTVSNGLDWSPDGSRAYYNDTDTYRVDVFDYDAEAGLTGEAAVRGDPAESGVPTGSRSTRRAASGWRSTDGGAVHRYTPDGALDEVVEVPARKVTACTFGGPRLDELFITTSREDLDARRRPARGLALPRRCRASAACRSASSPDDRAAELCCSAPRGDLAGRFLLPALAALRRPDASRTASAVVGAARQESGPGRVPRDRRRAARANTPRDVPQAPRAGARRARCDYRRVDVDRPGAASRGPRASGAAASPPISHCRPASSPLRSTALGRGGPAGGQPDRDREAVRRGSRQRGRAQRAARPRCRATRRAGDLPRRPRARHGDRAEPARPAARQPRHSSHSGTATHIEQVEILWEETLALEGRAGYFDSAGALKDVLQNHMLQILSLVAMEPPDGLDERELRDRKVGSPALDPAARTPTRSPYERAGRATRRDGSTATRVPRVRGRGGRRPESRHRDLRRARARARQLRAGRARGSCCAPARR